MVVTIYSKYKKECVFLFMMEPVCVELEPNRNAEAYRNYQASLSCEIQKHFDCIDISEDGQMIIGCSNLTGRYWIGSLWIFTQPEEVLKVENCLSGIHCDSGVVDGKFIENKDKVIIGEDSGAIQLLSLCESADEKTFTFESLAIACEHDDSVLSISLFSDKTKAVSGGSDMVIKVWDIETLTSEHTYRPAHTHMVSCVCAHPAEDNSVFASCSYDGAVLMWDTRLSKPAKVLTNNRAVELTAIDWHSLRNNTLAVGSNRGEVSLIDIRQSKDSLGQMDCFKRPIHSLRYSYYRSDWLAVCADDSVIKILDCSDNNMDVIYSDDRHADFVRGLAWYPKTEMLYSCGWDKQVLSHKPAPSSPIKMEVNGIINKEEQG